MGGLIQLITANKTSLETISFIALTIVIVLKLVEDLSERGSQASPGHSFMHWGVRWLVFAILITFVFGIFGTIPAV